MEVRKTNIEGVLLIQPKVFSDERGCFFEAYQQERYQEYGVPPLVQHNESVSKAGVLRGLHLQIDSRYQQGKLVRVSQGAITDVVVDLRPKSSTLGQHVSIRLSEENGIQLWIPPGFAHGFLAHQDTTRVIYGCSAYYHPGSEMSVAWNDPDLEIDWGIAAPVLSDKDAAGVSFSLAMEQIQAV